MMRVVKYAAGGVAVVLSAGAYTLVKYRPRSSLDVEYHESQTSIDRVPTNFVERHLFEFMRTIVIHGCASLARFVLERSWHVEFLDKEKLWRYTTVDRDGVPLVTITNHTSVLDDPGMMSVISPPSVTSRPRRMRWTVCSEELCFASPGVAAFFGAGKSLPITRGGSIHQKALATLQHKINGGEWVNIFSEGRVWQEQGMPLRDDQGRWCSAGGRAGLPWTKVGPLKWGVGKLVANAQVTPVVVPVYHTGLQDAWPQDYANQLIDGIRWGNGAHVTIRPGDPVPVADLIDAYHDAARQRAVARNSAREARLKREVQRLADEESAAAAAAAKNAFGGSGSGAWPATPPSPSSGGDARWAAWMWRALGFGGTAGKGVAAATPGAAGGAPATAAAAGGGGVDPRLAPVNTVEEASDHTGASARVAGIAAVATPQQAAESLEADKRAAVAGRTPPLPLLDEPIAASAERAGRAVTEVADRAKATLAETLASARATLSEWEGKATETAHEAERKARDLARRLRDVASANKKAADDASPAATDGKKGGDDSGTGSGSGSTGAPWKSSVSVPGPPRRKLLGDADRSDASDASSAAASPAASSGAGAASSSSSSAGAAAAPTAAPAAAAASAAGPRRIGAVPLSDAPVVEVVPTRTLRTGILVPQYVDAQLRIKPPDHEFLTPDEARQEEDIRLQLYAAIAQRIHDALVLLEREVFAHRAAKGIVESRPMQGVTHKHGPTPDEYTAAERDILAPYAREAHARLEAAWQRIHAQALVAITQQAQQAAVDAAAVAKAGGAASAAAAAAAGAASAGAAAASSAAGATAHASGLIDLRGRLALPPSAYASLDSAITALNAATAGASPSTAAASTTIASGSAAAANGMSVVSLPLLHTWRAAADGVALGQAGRTGGWDDVHALYTRTGGSQQLR